MNKRFINTWKWQDASGYSQAIEVSNWTHQLVCSGQASTDENGILCHPNNMAAQLEQAIDNIETILSHAGYSLGDIIRFNIFTTNVDEFFASWAPTGDRLAFAGCVPASTLLGVTRLADPGMMIEIEVTAVKGRESWVVSRQS